MHRPTSAYWRCRFSVRFYLLKFASLRKSCRKFFFFFVPEFGWKLFLKPSHVHLSLQFKSWRILSTNATAFEKLVQAMRHLAQPRGRLEILILRNFLKAVASIVLMLISYLKSHLRVSQNWRSSSRLPSHQHQLLWTSDPCCCDIFHCLQRRILF